MIKKLIVLAIAVIVLIALLLYNKSTVKKSSLDKMAVSQALKGSVSLIAMVKGSDTVYLAKKEGEWVTQEDDFPADTAKVNKLLDIMFKLQNKEIVSRNPDRVKEYGLDSATAKLVVLFDDTQKELFRAYIGKTSSADYNSTYWKKAGEDVVYRTPGNFTHNLSQKSLDWKYKKLFTFEKEDVQKIEVFWLDSLKSSTEFALKATGDGNWEMLSPKPGIAKKSPAETMARRFKELSIDEIPAEADRPDMSQPPTLEVTATLNDGTTHKIVAQKKDKYFYLKHPSREEIVKMNKWRLEVYEKSVDDLFDAEKTDSAAAAATAKDTAAQADTAFAPVPVSLPE